ncbi:MAG TPA: nuclear transport factor 2 family protein, partial [Actinomycetota bacterium]
MTDVQNLKDLLEAFNAHDLDRIMAFFADDCVLETRFDQLCARGTSEPEPVAGGNRCASCNRARPSRWRRRAYAIRHPAPPRRRK